MYDDRLIHSQQNRSLTKIIHSIDCHLYNMFLPKINKNGRYREKRK